MLIKRFLPFRVVGANALNGVWTLLKVFDPGWCWLRLMRICILPAAEMPSEASLAPECHGPDSAQPGPAQPGPSWLCHRWTRRWTFFLTAIILSFGFFFPSRQLFVWKMKSRSSRRDNCSTNQRQAGLPRQWKWFDLKMTSDERDWRAIMIRLTAAAKLLQCSFLGSSQKTIPN